MTTVKFIDIQGLTICHLFSLMHMIDAMQPVCDLLSADRKIFLMFRLKGLKILEDISELSLIPDGKYLINTINAYSYTMARRDPLFADALRDGDYLIPDGASIVKACRWINAVSKPRMRIAGWDLFMYEMRAAEERAAKTARKKVMFVGSSEGVLRLIRERAAIDFPHIEVVTYSPPYKPVFTPEDDAEIINAINACKPDLLWIGMTAPKQEKWAYSNLGRLDVCCHIGTIGAVFDFYAGTAKRAPLWWQRHSLEWLYRLIIEPRRMWRRYIIGNIKFLCYILQEKTTASCC